MLRLSHRSEAASSHTVQRLIVMGMDMSHIGSLGGRVWDTIGPQWWARDDQNDVHP